MSEDARTRRALELIRELSDPEGPTPGSDGVLSELGFDSLDFAELGLAFEEEFGLEIDEGSLDGSGSVGDLLAGVGRAVGAGGWPGLPSGVGRLQGAGDLLAGGPLRWWLGLEVSGAERVPERGPVVVAMNHESALDIPIAVIAWPRRITFMAKKELFRNGAVSWVLGGLGGFRVDRERFDLRAVRLGLAVLERGDVLGMYPEGTRSPGRLLPFLDGAAWLALRTGAPLVPLALSGTHRTDLARRPRRARVRAAFGSPIRVGRVDDPASRRRRATELTAELRAAIVLARDA